MRNDFLFFLDGIDWNFLTSLPCLLSAIYFAILMVIPWSESLNGAQIDWYLCDLWVCLRTCNGLLGKRHCLRNYCKTGWVNFLSCINLRNTWTNTSSFIWASLRCSFLSEQCFKHRVLCRSCQYLISIIFQKTSGFWMSCALS